MNMVVTTVLSVLINAIMHVFMRSTKLGLAMRATMEEPVGAQLVDVDLLRVHLVSFSIGCLTAMSAGSMERRRRKKERKVKDDVKWKFANIVVRGAKKRRCAIVLEKLPRQCQREMIEDVKDE